MAYPAYHDGANLTFATNGDAVNDSNGPVMPLSNLATFARWYSGYHGYIACVVCIFGVVANILNIIVLTRKNMQSPTNVILTGLAMTDGLTMAAYFPFALYFYVLSEASTLGAIRYLMFYALFSVLVHSMSIWLTVTLALFRYLFIRYPRKGAIYCSIQRAKLAVVLVAVAVSIVCLPNCLAYEIVHIGGVWGLQAKANTTSDIFLKNLNFWMQGVLVKLIPCVLLTVLSILLIRTMKVAERRRKKLMQKNHKLDDDNRRASKTNRTTRMLLTVVILFLITETPQGILHILNGTIAQFQHTVYEHFGDFIDILALINNGINFVLYCTMSKQFRDTFIVIFFKATRRHQHHLVPTQVSSMGRDMA